MSQNFYNPNTEPERTIDLNGESYTHTQSILAVVPPAMQLMLAGPYNTNAQEVLEGNRGVRYDTTYFNVLYPQSTARNPQPDNMAYLVLDGPGNSEGGATYFEHNYFDDNTIFADDDGTVTLYDVIRHEITYMSIQQLLDTAFMHSTFNLNAVFHTFFSQEHPVYGEHFDKEAIKDNLTWEIYNGNTNAYPLYQIADYVGVEINRAHFDKLYEAAYTYRL